MLTQQASFKFESNKNTQEKNVICRVVAISLKSEYECFNNTTYVACIQTRAPFTDMV